MMSSVQDESQNDERNDLCATGTYTCTGLEKVSEILDSTEDCPICLQKYLHPVKLPCNHVFCYLCCKGEGIKRKRCAMCRSEIPPEYFYEPTLIENEEQKEFALEDGHVWFYEGRNGWWQYDERSSVEIEENYKSGASSKEILIAGHLYVIDFNAMRQHRINQPGRYRKIKRDLCTVPKKGVAGLKINNKQNISPQRHDGDGNVTETDSLSSNVNTSPTVRQSDNEPNSLLGADGERNIQDPQNATSRSPSTFEREFSTSLTHRDGELTDQNTLVLNMTPSSTHSTIQQRRKSPRYENNANSDQPQNIEINNKDLPARNANVGEINIQGASSVLPLPSERTDVRDRVENRRSLHASELMDSPVLPTELNVSSEFSNLSLRNAAEPAEGTRGVRRRQRTLVRAHSPLE